MNILFIGRHKEHGTFWSVWVKARYSK